MPAGGRPASGVEVAALWGAAVAVAVGVEVGPDVPVGVEVGPDVPVGVGVRVGVGDAVVLAGWQVVLEVLSSRRQTFPVVPPAL